MDDVMRGKDHKVSGWATDWKAFAPVKVAVRVCTQPGSMEGQS